LNHIKVTERVGQRSTVSNKEIRETSLEIDEPERTVRAWITEGARPVLYPTLETAMSKDEAEAKINKIRDNLNGVDSYDKLQKRLAHTYHETYTKAQVSYPKDDESAKKYYDFLDEMIKGGTIADVSKRIGTSQGSGSRYLEGRIPRLIQRAMEPIPKSYRQESGEEYQINPPVKYEQALQRHPFVRDQPDFSKLDYEARVYTELTGLKSRGELPDRLVKDLAKEYGVRKDRLASWLSERKTQELVRRLERYEAARVAHEGKLAKEAFDHRIDPSTVYEHFRHLREVKNPSSDELAEALERLLKASGLNTKVQWVELSEYHNDGPKWLRDVAIKIAEDRDAIESALNQRMGLGKKPGEMIRLGVLESKVYVRREDTSEWNWLNIYKNEAFHFGNQEQIMI
jgi:hypothetical protein